MMSKSLIASLAVLALTQSVQSTDWVNGLNMPVHYWGLDYGHSFDENWFRNSLQKYKNDGANTVRIWVYFNGNTDLQLYDSNGYFLSPSSQFLNDITKLLTMSRDTGIKVLFSMFSFECADNDKCNNMITDPNKNVPFINNGLSKLLDHINE
jgi:arabinogalactan endo-1,4-beta-galactosidase